MPDTTPPDPDRTGDFAPPDPAASDALKARLTDAVDGLLGRKPVPVLDWAGREVEGYRLIRVRNRDGGQGVVYEGYDTTLGRKVAVKVARPDRPTDELEQEAKWTARLGGKGIVPIIRLVRDPEYPTQWMVMEWLDGRTVEELIRPGPGGEPRPFPWDRAFRIAAEVLETLGRVHEGVDGKAHLDVKPSNVFVPDRGGEVKLLDLGLAAHLDPDLGDPGRTAYCGTLFYMAPERFHVSGADGPPPDGRRCDVYSVGATLYHMLTGTPPFPRVEGRADYPMFASAHRDAPRPDPRAAVPGLPPFCTDIVRKAMAVDPAARYPTAEAFRADLLRHLGPAAPGRPRRRAAVLVGIIAAVAAAVGVAVALNTPGRTPRADDAGTAAVNPPLAPPAAPAPAPVVPPAPAPRYRGKIDVLIPRAAAGRVATHRLNTYGALPLRTDDRFQVVAEVDPPAYLYVFWVEPDGTVAPVYPWDPEKDEWTRPKAEGPRGRLNLPDQESFTLTTDQTGVTTLVLFARPTPLDVSDDKVKGWFAGLPPQPLPADERAAAVWFDDYTLVAGDPFRSGVLKRVPSADPLQRWQAALKARVGGAATFQTAVCFTRTGKD